MTAAGDLSARNEASRPGLLVRWWRRRRVAQRRIDHAVWDLRERYGEAAYNIARASAHQPSEFGRRRFWREVARRLQRLS